MTQIHCYIPDDMAAKLRKKADQRHLSVSKYLANLVKNDISTQWPEGYFEAVLGQWEGTPLKRPDQGVVDKRDTFK